MSRETKTLMLISIQMQEMCLNSKYKRNIGKRADGASKPTSLNSYAWLGDEARLTTRLCRRSNNAKLLARIIRFITATKITQSMAEYASFALESLQGIKFPNLKSSKGKNISVYRSI
jgi:hypothetical protein